jgi:hypothetical protein
MIIPLQGCSPNNNPSLWHEDSDENDNILIKNDKHYYKPDKPV